MNLAWETKGGKEFVTHVGVFVNSTPRNEPRI